MKSSILVFILFFLLFIEKWNWLNFFNRYSHRYCRLIYSKSFRKYFLVFLFVCTRWKNKKCFHVTASSYLPYLFFCKLWLLGDFSYVYINYHLFLRRENTFSFFVHFYKWIIFHFKTILVNKRKLLNVKIKRSKLIYVKNKYNET